MNGGVVVIVVGILSLILAILSVIFITPRSKKPYLSGFSLWLHQLFNFDILLIDKILKFFYIFSTAAVILFGFAVLFYIGYIGGEALLISLGLILLGPIVIRLLYEGIMLMVILVRNVAEINNKLPEAAGTGKSAPAAASARSARNHRFVFFIGKDSGRAATPCRGNGPASYQKPRPVESRNARRPPSQSASRAPARAQGRGHFAGGMVV